MIASQIKVGTEYAVHTSPRKGVKDLYDLSARRVVVKDKGIERFAEHAMDGYGDVKSDGIRVEWHASAIVSVLKARDFLMPWNEYSEEQERRDQIKKNQAEERKVAQAAQAKRMEAILTQFTSMGMVGEASGTFWI